MEEKVSPVGSLLEQTLSDAAVDLDLINEFLTGDFIDLLQPGTSTATSPFGFSAFSPVFEISNGSPNQIPPGTDIQDDVGASAFQSALDSDDAQLNRKRQSLQLSWHSLLADEMETGNIGYEPGMSSSIRPGVAMLTVQERLAHALGYIKDSQSEGGVLVQIWVPNVVGDRQVLITHGQPYCLDSNCQSLVDYRGISTKYQFLADENSHEAIGLPGRVFLCKLPEWSPDVRFFSSHEYHRVIDAQRFGVRGTVALPIFERGSRACLGVIEVVMTTQKINYSSDLENICNALQAVDLRSSQVSNVPRILVTGSYQAVLPEIQGVLRAACEAHSLPLAQTWISCVQHGKSGSRHSDETYKDCVSTFDAACYVQDPCILGFHNACSEHHLLRGQGVVGKAFITNQPCFSSDITAFSKLEYPLSHHAKLFNLKAAVAIRLRSIHTEKADFVLEFFLPATCVESNEQKAMLNSLSITIQQLCRSLRVLTTKELENDIPLEKNALTRKKTYGNVVYKSIPDELLSVGHPEEISEMIPSWTSSMIIAQQDADNVLLTSILSKQSIENFSLETHSDPLGVQIPAGKMLSELIQNHGVSDTDHKNYFSGKPSISKVVKPIEKKRTKAEKVISLQDLRKYFAGSLKDAAKALGVCPTTLKRICRQHGIARWPSRKIKKVGHSLKKLQVVIDSVHGPEEAFQLSSFYENFAMTTWSDNSAAAANTMSLLKDKNQQETFNTEQHLEVQFSSHTAGSNSLSSSPCSRSSSSSLSSGHKLSSDQIGHEQESLQEENQSSILKKVHSLIELQVPTNESPKSVVRSQSRKFFIKHHLTGSDISNFLKVKAIFGEDKVIFRLQPTWGFQELRQEVKNRFNIGDATLVYLNYLDDDSDWVLLTCDADLQECIDVYKSSSAHMIKIHVRVAHEITFIDNEVS